MHAPISSRNRPLALNEEIQSTETIPGRPAEQGHGRTSATADRQFVLLTGRKWPRTERPLADDLSMAYPERPMDQR